MTEGTITIANADTQTLLDAIEMERAQREMRVVYRTGSAWFFPEIRMTGFLATIDLNPDTYTTTISFTATNTEEPHFRNALARPVYWLWMHVWLKLRRLAQRGRTD
jgi:hypothetical protein